MVRFHCEAYADIWRIFMTDFQFQVLIPNHVISPLSKGFSCKMWYFLHFCTRFYTVFNKILWHRIGWLWHRIHQDSMWWLVMAIFSLMDLLWYYKMWKQFFRVAPWHALTKFFRLSYIDESCYNSKTINLLVQ